MSAVRTTRLARLLVVPCLVLAAGACSSDGDPATGAPASTPASTPGQHARRR